MVDFTDFNLKPHHLVSLSLPLEAVPELYLLKLINVLLDLVVLNLGTNFSTICAAVPRYPEIFPEHMFECVPRTR